MKLTERDIFASTLSDSDLLHIVDVSDTKQSPDGSSFKLTIGQLKAAIPNIYNSNGTLSGARVVTQAGFDLSFQGGNVGFGISSPTAKITIKDEAGGGGNLFNVLKNNNSEIFSIDNTGNTSVINIFKTESLSRFQVDGNGIRLWGLNSTHFDFFGFGAGSTSTLYIKNGRVGINNNNPTDTLHTIGDVKLEANNVGNDVVLYQNDRHLYFPSLDTYASDVLAGAGGLTVGCVYQTATGELRIKL